MPTFTAGNASVSAKASEIIASALTELNIVAAGNAAPADEVVWGLEKLQRLIDRFNARREMIYNQAFTSFNLQANHSPHTIGPTGDFNLVQRPVRLVSAALVLSTIDLPITVRDDDWWAAQTLKSLTSTLPTDVFYSPDLPNGSLFFWPISKAVNAVRLETWVGLTQAVDGTTALAMPPAYWDAVVLTLARDLAPSYGPAVTAVVSSPPFQSTLRDAMKAIEGNNATSHRLFTDVPSTSSSANVRPGFNFLTGK